MNWYFCKRSIIGIIITIIFTRIKIMIPVKIFIINIFSSYISFLVFYIIYNNCIGAGCDKDYIDNILIIIHLFIILKFDLSIVIITILYFIYRVYFNKF